MDFRGCAYEERADIVADQQAKEMGGFQAVQEPVSRF
jgi:hypothetical protein